MGRPGRCPARSDRDAHPSGRPQGRQAAHRRHTGADVSAWQGQDRAGPACAYVIDDRPSGATTPALVWYRFTPDLSGIHPQAELKHFAGLLQADGYAGYDKLYEGDRVLEVACWAHFRRKIFENHQTSPTPLTTDLLERIAGLYRIEDEIRGGLPELRRRQRQEELAVRRLHRWRRAGGRHLLRHRDREAQRY